MVDVRALRWLALTLMIRAIFPSNDAIMDAAELLRDAAKKAGCLDPRLTMRSLGGDKGIEIEIRCADQGDTHEQQ